MHDIGYVQSTVKVHGIIFHSSHRDFNVYWNSYGIPSIPQFRLKLNYLHRKQNAEPVNSFN